ncbi:hypothetical protein V5P93_001642 [Actinokineospora auranticolor]|uniref:Putative T7SS secretion signal domain-containing protein n=1 Tax=Actinokineospora auranticolor TaxID=155976 RepID=A0A2S6GCD6_9PSEU|nr:hypothetical protein [Actinokineospora auranticolor]PPK62375.1 hypothetical protein CLV40_13517 [Actinokineospora auranticolor]
MRSYPTLGFDPVPGEQAAVRTTLVNLAEVQTMLGEVTPRLTEACKITDDADWGGSAAEEFSDHGDDLPKGIAKGAESMQAVTKALLTWAGRMKANQDKADELEAKAKRLKQQASDAANAESAAAGAIPRDTSHPQYDSRYNAFLAAVDAASTAQAAFDKVIDDARRLERKHLREANETAEQIRSGPDEVFKPENDGWDVQVLDGIARTSGIVSSAAAVVAAGSLAIPLVGEAVAPVAGTVSAGAGTVNTLAGLGQKAVGSANAPSWLDIGLGAIPGRTITSGVVGAGKGLLGDAVEGGSRLRRVTKGAADGARGGFESEGLGKLTKDLRELRELAENNGSVRDAIREKALKDLREKGDKVAARFQDPEKFTQAQRDALGRLRAAGDAFTAAVDTTVKSAQAAGVEFTPAQRREIELLKLAGNPGRAGAEKAAINMTASELREPLK